MNSMTRVILRGKGISISTEKGPFLGETGPAAPAVQAQENREPLGRAPQGGAPFPRRGGRNGAESGNCLFHQQKYWMGGGCTSSSLSGRTAIGRGRSKCCGPNLSLWLISR